MESIAENVKQMIPYSSMRESHWPQFVNNPYPVGSKEFHWSRFVTSIISGELLTKSCLKLEYSRDNSQV